MDVCLTELKQWELEAAEISRVVMTTRVKLLDDDHTADVLKQGPAFVVQLKRQRV